MNSSPDLYVFDVQRVLDETRLNYNKQKHKTVTERIGIYEYSELDARKGIIYAVLEAGYRCTRLTLVAGDMPDGEVNVLARRPKKKGQ